MTIKITVTIAALAGLAPFVARRPLFACVALAWAAYGLWEVRGALWRMLGALWRCLTPASRVGAAVLVGFALTSFPPWVDAPIVVATVLGTAALNRRREARQVREARQRGGDAVYNTGTRLAREIIDQRRAAFPPEAAAIAPARRPSSD